MDEAFAWLAQAQADYLAGEQLTVEDSRMWCHAIALYQQVVEKAVKAAVLAVRKLGVRRVSFAYRHDVLRYVSMLVHLPQDLKTKSFRSQFQKILDQDTQSGIRILDGLVPAAPTPGALVLRNTEYPFQIDSVRWSYPAKADCFSREELERFRAVANRLVNRLAKIVTTIHRVANR